MRGLDASPLAQALPGLLSRPQSFLLTDHVREQCQKTEIKIEMVCVVKHSKKRE